MNQSSFRPDFWIKTLEASFNQGWFSTLQAIAYDSTSHCVAVGGDKGKVAFLDLGTGESQESSSLGEKIRALCFGAAGEIFVGTEYGSVLRLSVRQGLPELTQKISDKAITCLAYHNRHGLLVGADDCKVRIVSPCDLSIKVTSQKEGSYVQDVAFTPDGSRALSAGCDNCLRIYELPGLEAATIVHRGDYSQREAAAASGIYVGGSKDGLVSIIRSDHQQSLTCLPVSSEEIVSVMISVARHSLITVDAKGQLQDWDLADLKPLSALDSELTTKAVAMADSGDVIVFCSENRVVAYLRASALDQLKTYKQHRRSHDSLIGRIQRLLRRIFKKPNPPAPLNPRLPQAAARIALMVDKESLEHERSLSETFVACYDTISKSARKIDWNAVSRVIKQQQRAELERQKQEFRQMREERLAQAAEEAKRRREFREQLYRERQEAIKQAELRAAQLQEEARRNSGSFWRGVGRLLSDSGSSSSSSSSRTRQVRSYVRKDGTRVRSYKRR